MSQLFCIMVPSSQGSLFTIMITIILPLPFSWLVSFTKNGRQCSLQKLLIQGSSELRERERCGLHRKVDISLEIWWDYCNVYKQTLPSTIFTCTRVPKVMSESMQHRIFFLAEFQIWVRDIICTREQFWKRDRGWWIKRASIMSVRKEVGWDGALPLLTHQSLEFVVVQKDS